MKMFFPERAVQTIALGWFLALAPCLANENVAEYDSSVAGQLVPAEETAIEVGEEDLRIRFEIVPHQDIFDVGGGTGSDLPVRVHVTARYRLRNTAAEDRTPLLVFPILRGGLEERRKVLRLNLAPWENKLLSETTRRGLRGEVTFDGKPLPHEYVAFESLFDKERPRLVQSVRQWLSQWPALQKIAESKIVETMKLKDGSLEPRRPYDESTPYSSFIRRQVEQDSLDQRLLYLTLTQIHRHERIDDWDLEALSFIHAALHPDATDPVAEFLARWGVESQYLNPFTGKRFEIDPLHGVGMGHYEVSRLNRRIDFLQYRPTLPANRDVTLEVKFSHLLDVNMYRLEPNERGAPLPYTNQFQYILRTSPKWRTFGPINLRLEIACHLPRSISPSLTYEQEREGYDCYRWLLNGADAKKNLLVGILPQDRWERSGAVGWLPGDERPQGSTMRDSWKRYEAKPTGPFADDLLYRMGQRMMAGRLRPDDTRFLAERMYDKETNYNIPPQKMTEYASWTMRKITSRHPARRCDGLLMAKLFYHAGREVNVSEMESLRKDLQELKRRERSYRFEPERGMTQKQIDAGRARLKDTPVMLEFHTLQTFLRLCDTFLAPYEKGHPNDAPEAQGALLKSALAKLFLQRRFERLPWTDLRARSFSDQKKAEIIADLLAIYDLHRESPEAPELMRLLGCMLANVYYWPSRSGRTTDMDQQLQALARRIRQECAEREIEIPDEQYIRIRDWNFPDWLRLYDER